MPAGDGMGVATGEREARPLPGGRGATIARRTALAVALLTAGALLLRYAGIRQSLFGDELFTYAVARPGLHGLVDRIQSFELNPPLFFVLAALSAKLGDPAVLLRLPSLLFGTATVPLVYLLGARTVGRAPGLVAAAVLAVSPFAVFYGTEARAYATVTFLVVCSALALLVALRRDRPLPWAAFALVAAASLYTHYTAVFPLAALFAWAVWRRPRQRRHLLLAYVAVAALFAPWLPFLGGQGDTFALLYRLSPGYLARSQASALFGHPFVGLDRIPGLAGMLVLGAVLAAGAVAAWMRRRGRPSDGLLLVLALAIATPVGMLLDYALGGGNLISPRNLWVSVPAMLLLVGLLVSSLPRPLAALATVAMVCVLLAGTARTLAGRFQRPAFRAAAHLVDRSAGPAVPVLESPFLFLFAGTLERGTSLLLAGDNPLRRDIAVELRRPHRLYTATGFARIGRTITPTYPREAWRRGRSAGALWVISAVGRPLTPREVVQRARFVPPLPPSGSGRWRVAVRRSWQGLVRVVAIKYVPVGP